MTLAFNICLILLVFAFTGIASSITDASFAPKPLPWFNCSNTDPDSYQCCSFFQYMYNNTVNASHHKHNNDALNNDSAIAILYSGHSINDLGFYNLCVERGDRNYFLMELTEGSLNVPDGSFGFYFGLCLPQYCSLSYLQSESATLTERLQLLGLPYAQNLEAVFIDPNAYTIENDFYLVVAIIVLVAIVIMNLLGTYIPYWAKVDQPAPPALPPRPQNPNAGGLNDSVSQRSDSFQGDSFISNDPRRPSFRMKTATYLKTHPKLLKTLECFNFHKNMKSFFRQEKDARMDTSLNALDGVRTLSFIGIVYAHTFLNSAVSKNEFSTVQFEKEPGSLIALAAFFGVDIFLILSGFLQGFQLTSKLKRMPLSLKNYLLLIRHRWVRIVPTYFVAMLLYWKIGPHLGSGPLWYQYVDRAQQCTNAWWKNVFFLDNAMNTGSRFYCFNWGWYLACDFQVFLLAPFIIWIYLKKRSRGHNVIWLLLVISMVAGFIATTDVNFKYSIPPAQGQGNYWADFYSDTLVRMSSYLIGILIGTQYRVFKNGETNNIFGYCAKSKPFGYMIFCLGLFFMLFEMFFPRVVQTGTQWSDGFNFFWQVIDRPMLAGGIFLIMIPGIVGMMKPINWFFGSYLFVLGSKLSFCGYLVQDIVILLILRSEAVFLGFSFGNKNMLAIGFIMLSVAAGIVLHLLVEKPAGNMETTFLSIKLQEQKPDQKSKINFSDNSVSQSSKVQERRKFDGNSSSPEKTEISPNRDLSPA